MNKYRLYCEICNWNRVVDNEGLNNFFEIKGSSIPSNIPKYDEQEKRTINFSPKKRKRKFRCPSCGRVIIAKKVPDPQKQVNEYWEKIQRQEEIKQREAEDAKHQAEYEATRQEYEEEDRFT